MRRNILIYIALLAIVAFNSCTDWLEEANPNMSDKDSYWQNLNQTNSTLTAAYATLLSDFALNIREEAPRSDMATPGFGRPTYSGEGAVWYTHNYHNSNSVVTQKWEILYMGIFRANQVIDGLKNMKDVNNQEAWDIQMAQARFLRGLYHFYLHSTYNEGNIIIKDKVPGEYEDFMKKLSPSAEVIEFFRNDLQFAFDNLPDVYPEAGDRGRATKGAAATLLGTSYLYEATLPDPGNVDLAQIDSARVKFEYVINNGQYELVKDLEKLFTTAGAMNEESIFEIAFSSVFNSEYGNWDEDRMTNRLAFAFDGRGSNANNVFPSLWITHAYLNETIDSLQVEDNQVDKVINETTGETEKVWRPVSRRASAMIALVQDEYTAYYNGLAHNRIPLPSNDKRTQNGFSRFKHHINHDILEDEKDLPGGKQLSGKHITVNRLGDVYMMLAECYIYENRLDDALNAINMVRKRWGLELIGLSNGDISYSYNEVAYNQSTLLERLQEVEKPLETSIEGHSIRWFDLRRWGKLQSNFEKRAAQTWYSANYFVTQGENANRNKQFSTITDTYDATDPAAVMMKDFEQAAANFDYNKHAWLPIPSVEEVDNSEL